MDLLQEFEMQLRKWFRFQHTSPSLTPTPFAPLFNWDSISRLWRSISAIWAAAALAFLAEDTAEATPPATSPAAPRPAKISGNNASSGKRPPDFLRYFNCDEDRKRFKPFFALVILFICVFRQRNFMRISIQVIFSYPYYHTLLILGCPDDLPKLIVS